MRRRQLLGAAGVALFLGGLVIGALAFPGDDDGTDTSKPLRPTRSVPPSSTPTGYATQPVLAGILHDGRPWTLRLDPNLEFCTIIGNVDFGCDVPNVNPPDRAGPRKAVEATPFSDPQSGILLYGFLPQGATQAELVYADGRTRSADLNAEPTTQFWAAPITPGDNPSGVVYRNAEGTEVARYPA